MDIVKTISELREKIEKLRYTTAKSVPLEVGFVPTMGALHRGHLSLIKRSMKENRITVVSIYLNPTQFDNPEDLKHYPVSLEDDKKLLLSAGIDILFLPQYQEIYNDKYTYKLSENRLSNLLCGASRPGHFDGVLTIVLKLLNIINANRAYFGEKDYQQYLLIKGMADALFLQTEICPCPIIREASGLAISSRNQRLSKKGRKEVAPLFYKKLSEGGPLQKIKEELINVGFKVDYIEEVEHRLFGAVILEGIRLIDNVKR